MLKLDDAAIAELSQSQGYWYLGSAYTHHDAGIEEAARMASRAAGLLISKGVNVFSPSRTAIPSPTSRGSTRSITSYGCASTSR